MNESLGRIEAQVIALDRKLDSQIDRVDRRIDLVIVRLEIVEQKVDVLDQKVDALDRKIDTTADRLDRKIDVSVEALQGDIRTVAEGLVALGERMDRRFDEMARDNVAFRASLFGILGNHEERISTLERRES
jgi:peptidoglycan hydrolase CwlO-like protein